MVRYFLSGIYSLRFLCINQTPRHSVLWSEWNFLILKLSISVIKKSKSFFFRAKKCYINLLG